MSIYVQQILTYCISRPYRLGRLIAKVNLHKLQGFFLPKKDIEAYRRIYIETKDGSEIIGRVVTLSDNYLVLEKDSVLISDIELIGIYQYGTQAVGGCMLSSGVLLGALSVAFLYAAYLSDFNGSNGLIEMVLTAMFGTASIASWHVGHNVFYYKKKYNMSDGWSLMSN